MYDRTMHLPPMRSHPLSMAAMASVSASATSASASGAPVSASGAPVSASMASASASEGAGKVDVDVSTQFTSTPASTGAAAEQSPYEPSFRPLATLEQHLKCPLSGKALDNPVLACNGTTYDREAIENWFATHDTWPGTNTAIDDRRLVPNNTVRSIYLTQCSEPVLQLSGVIDHVIRDCVSRLMQTNATVAWPLPLSSIRFGDYLKSAETFAAYQERRGAGPDEAVYYTDDYVIQWSADLRVADGFVSVWSKDSLPNDRHHLFIHDLGPISSPGEVCKRLMYWYMKFRDVTFCRQRRSEGFCLGPVFYDEPCRRCAQEEEVYADVVPMSDHEEEQQQPQRRRGTRVRRPPPPLM